MCDSGNGRQVCPLHALFDPRSRAEWVEGPPGFTRLPARLSLVYFLRADVARGACAKNNTIMKQQSSQCMSSCTHPLETL